MEIAMQRFALQREVETREAWLKTVLRRIGDSLIATDVEGRVMLMNDAAENLTGWTGAEALGMPLNRVVRLLEGHLTTGEESPLANIEPSNGDQLITGTLLRRDGQPRVVMCSLTPIHTGGNSPEGMIVLLHNVSDLRKAEQALRDNNATLAKSNEQLTQLAHSLSHELKEPLRHVGCFAGLLELQYGSVITGKGQEYLKIIREGCYRMEKMLSSLLDYYQADVMDLAPISVDSHAVFVESLQNLEAALGKTNALVEAATLPHVSAHPTALLLIFQNLIANAIKYQSGVAPVIRISAACEGELWKFSVSDNGIGFDPRKADFIFGLFHRVPGSNCEGSGVGLATCRRLVERYGGHIWAEPAPGRGSAFHFTLPGVGEPVLLAVN